MLEPDAESTFVLKTENVLVGGGLVLAAVWWMLEPTGRGAAEAAAVLVMLLVVARLLARRDASLRSERRAVAREHVLSDAGTALIAATDAVAVHRVAVEAAGLLLAECPGARATIVGMDPDVWTVTQAAGFGADAVLGRRIPAADVPADVLRRLMDGRVVVVDDVAAFGCTDADATTDRPYRLLPLLTGDRFFGLLSVSAAGELPAEVFQSLQALRTQVSLALDSVALTEELRARAVHDPLTGLGNRALLRDRLTGALARSRRSGRPVGALLLDLNGFKKVNDTHGHTVGDELLKVVAQRLRESVRTEDVVGRLGGDEFVVIAEDLHSARDAMVIAERIVAALDEPITVGNRRLRTPASVGIALSHADMGGPDELLRLADVSMYAAKRDGGGYRLHGVAEAVPAGA